MSFQFQRTSVHIHLLSTAGFPREIRSFNFFPGFCRLVLYACFLSWHFGARLRHGWVQTMLISSDIFNQHRTTVVLHYFHFSLLSLLTAITHDTQIHENIKEMLVALLVILSRRPFRMVQRMQMRRSSLLTSSVHQTQLKMKLKIYEHEEQQIDEREYSKKKEWSSIRSSSDPHKQHLSFRHFWMSVCNLFSQEICLDQVGRTRPYPFLNRRAGERRDLWV